MGRFCFSQGMVVRVRKDFAHFGFLYYLITWSTFVSSLSVPSTTNEGWKEPALRAASLLAEAKSLLFVTGAGISAEAGLPTYRGTGGIYVENDGRTEEGYSIEDCLSGHMYRQNPAVTWKYLLQIERACRGVQPSRAHTLVALAEQHVDPVTVMTQNVDGLHVRAGSSDVIELHGDLYRLYCPTCGAKEVVNTYESFDNPSTPLPPPCPACSSGSIRPNVVLFDEFLGEDTIRRYEGALGGIGMVNPDAYDLVISIGTSALFRYVMSATLSGKSTVEINPSTSSISHQVDLYIPAGATEALEFMYKQIGWIE